tara:strand:- start:1111 stop:1272 length:162 start_codon:yes stop_codon:yes gene_type:complete
MLKIYLTDPPTTIEEEMIIRFLMMYCPSSVRLNGKSTKQTLGSNTSGKKVPGI